MRFWAICKMLKGASVLTPVAFVVSTHVERESRSNEVHTFRIIPLTFLLNDGHDASDVAAYAKFRESPQIDAR
jgi:hypothetical protein